MTGFEPFGGDARNPSQEVVAALPERISGRVIRRGLLAVDATSALPALSRLIAETEPAAVLMLGLAAGRPQPSLERVAVNRLDHHRPDNAGRTAISEPIVHDGPDAYLSSLPLRAIATAWREAGIPGTLSDTAGTFLCNAVFYQARHLLRDRAPAGFLHLPDDEALALTRRHPGPYVPLDHQTRAVLVAAETIVRHLGRDDPAAA